MNVTVNIDRTIHLVVEDGDPDSVREKVTTMCQQLIANPVLEDFEVIVG
jgi:phosphoribosylformylglycinamidine synthase PurS subunit